MSDDLNKEALQTVTESARPIADRVATIAAARHIYQKLAEADYTDSFRRNRIRGQIDGKPPMDPKLMADTLKILAE